jgi:HEAT repeat protein
VAALGDADEVVRAKALTKLSEPGCGRESLPALLGALKTPAARKRVAPLVALLGRDAAVAPLVSVLGEGTADDRDAVRAAVAYASRRTAAAELSALVTGERTADARLDLLRALDARLAEIPSVADASITTLLAGAPVLTTRYLLLDVIARLATAGDAEARTRLADLVLHDVAREVRTHATELLTTVGDSALVAIKALSDPEPRVREAALHVVGALKRADATPLAADLLAHDPWTFVRVSAADALGALPRTPASDRALGDALDQLSPRVREGAILALARRNARSYAGAIQDRLTDAKEDPTVHVAAARALGLLCDAKSTDLLVHFAVAGASSPDPAEVAVGLVATSALGKLHPVDLASRFAPLHAKGVRPDARAAADRAMADALHCALP